MREFEEFYPRLRHPLKQPLRGQAAAQMDGLVGAGCMALLVTCCSWWLEFPGGATCLALVGLGAWDGVRVGPGLRAGRVLQLRQILWMAGPLAFVVAAGLAWSAEPMSSVGEALQRCLLCGLAGGLAGVVSGIFPMLVGLWLTLFVLCRFWRDAQHTGWPEPDHPEGI